MKSLSLLLVLNLFIVSCMPTEFAEQKKVDDDDKIISSTRCETSLHRRLSAKSNDGIIYAEGKLHEIVYDGDLSLEKTLTKYEYQFTATNGIVVKIDEDFPSIKIQPQNTPIVMAMVEFNGGYAPFYDNTQDVIQYTAPIDENTGCDQSASSRNLQTRNTSITTKSIALFLADRYGYYNQAKVDALAKLLTDYWHKVSKGHYKIEVHPFYVPLSGTESFEAAADNMQAEYEKTKGIKIAYKHYLYYSGSQYHPTFDRHICGVAGGFQARTYCVSPRTMLHEQGHSFGYGHASSATYEYGDDSNIMGSYGNQNIGRHLHAQQIAQGNFQKDGGFRELTKTEKVFLAPIAADDRAVYAGVDQIIKARDNYIGFRGGPQDEFEIYTIKVQIHTKGTYLGSSMGSTIRATISEGESTYYGRIRVKFIKVVDGYAEVDIYYNSGDAAPAARQLPNNGPVCTGDIPTNSSLCANDQEGLGANLALSLVNICTEQRKCEYTCGQGYKMNLAGNACVVDTNVCEGNIPANAKLCSNDNILLQNNVTNSLVGTCTEQKKCEYICDSTHQLINGSCSFVKGVEIFASKSGKPNGVDKSFAIASDTITWRVREIGPNGKACISFKAADGSSGSASGFCDGLNNFTTMKDVTSPWFWSEQYQVWALTQKLSSDGYSVPGTYQMHWYNPETGKRNQYNYTLIP